MSAAVVTMMLASCTNEELVNQGTDGRMFTLEVTKGTDSRTALDGLQTVWSEGDKIYVTSEDGKTTGVLTLASKPGLPDGTFQGYIFGEGELKYSVYPVPTQEGLNLGAADVNKLDAPMTGEINAGTASFVNSCGLVKLNVLGLGDKDVVKVSGDEIGSVMEYDLATNSWVKKSAGTTITITGAQDATEFFVPVYTTNTTATDVELSVSVNDGLAQKVTVPVAVKKVNPKTPILAVTSTGDVVDPSNAESGTLGENYVYVDTETELQDAIGTVYKPQGKANYIIVKKNDYNISSGTEMQIKRSITIVGENGVNFIADNSLSSARVFNIYGGYVKENEIMNVTIKNITITGNTTKSDIYMRSSTNTDVDPQGDFCNLNVTLENVVCRKSNIDNNYIDGAVINLNMENCDIRQLTVDASPFNGNGIETRSNVWFDMDTNVGILIQDLIENNGLNNITINNETPTKRGWFVEYKEK